jgi:hypothetical protein
VKQEVKLNCLLGVVRKKKKSTRLYGSFSKLSGECMFVFNYFYKLNKDDDFIMNEWLSLRRTRTRDIDYNTIQKKKR